MNCTSRILSMYRQVGKYFTMTNKASIKAHGTFIHRVSVNTGCLGKVALFTTVVFLQSLVCSYRCKECEMYTFSILNLTKTNERMTNKNDNTASGYQV